MELLILKTINFSVNKVSIYEFCKTFILFLDFENEKLKVFF